MKNRKYLNRFARLVSAGFLLALTAGGGVVYAANNTDVTQTINAGTLTADIRDASRVPVASPTFAMSATTFSFSCQSSTGTIGSSTQRLYVDNPDTADSGWTLSVAATDGATGLWENSGVTNTFDYNDPTAAGCTDSADTDTKAGQLTINPSVGTLTADCTSCATTNITKGSSSAYNQGTVDSITLLNAAAGSDDIGRWYLTGVSASQTIPADQPVDNYSINLTITVTAL